MSTTTGPTTTGHESAGHVPAVRCADCGGLAEWAPQWGTHMHVDEDREDTHAVVVLPAQPTPQPLTHPLLPPRG